MKGTDKAIFMGVGVLVLALGFYFMVLAPKRQKASDLRDQVTSLEASVSALNQQADAGEQARQHYPAYYGSLVVLGKAVPDQADSASMIVQLNSIADRSKVQFRGLELGQGGSGSSSGSGAAISAASAITSAASSSGSSGSTSSTGTSTAPTSTSGTSTTPTTGSSTSAPASSTGGSATTAAPATEDAAATLPIGAVVGPAGLPTLPYTLTFKGGFFDVANFIGGLDGLVQLNHQTGQVAANGRLLTVDGFALNGGTPGSSPQLDATFEVTSYVTPSELGLTGGATPGGPAPSPTGQAPTTPVSGSVGG